MNTHDIIVPFPEEMTQDDYDQAYTQKFFWDNFPEDEYFKKCDIVDNEFEKLLSKKQKTILIEYKDIPEYFDKNYLKTKVELLRSRGVPILEVINPWEFGISFTIGDDK